MIISPAFHLPRHMPCPILEDAWSATMYLQELVEKQTWALTNDKEQKKIVKKTVMKASKKASKKTIVKKASKKASKKALATKTIVKKASKKGK